MELRTLNKNFVATEYAVRGGIPAHAEVVRTHPNEYPDVTEMTYCNIGNPQKLGQKPLRFFREVLALCQYPRLLELCPGSFSQEAITRAKMLISDTDGCGFGCYTGSQGLLCIRKQVAAFIEARDSLPPGTVSEASVFLTDGASTGVKLALQMLLDVDQPASTGFLISIPQYPLYSATVRSMGATVVPYYLREEDGWTIDTQELAQQIASAHASGVNVRALCVINPGNPSGTVLTRQVMDSIVEFADSNNLVLIADEVYQDNVYAEGKAFISFQRVVYDHCCANSGHGPQLISLHSTSKGVTGECGFRGGYFTLTNVPEPVAAVFRKMVSVSLCPNTSGQVLVSCMVSPPALGTKARIRYEKERRKILDDLHQRASIVTMRLNSIPGITCAPVEGALYAFPRIYLPNKAIEAAKMAGDATPDYYYCRCLVEKTGIVVVPGSGFGQVDGTWHFRMTILPPLAKFNEFLDKFEHFHTEFMRQFSK